MPRWPAKEDPAGSPNDEMKSPVGAVNPEMDAKPAVYRARLKCEVILSKSVGVPALGSFINFRGTYDPMTGILVNDFKGHEVLMSIHSANVVAVKILPTQ